MNRLSNDQKYVLNKLYSAVEKVKKVAEKDEEFKQYIEDMELFDLQGRDLDDILSIISDHLYPQF